MNRSPLTSVSALSRCLGLAVLAMGVSGCALLSIYIQDTGVDIETISTRSARIVSARFYREGEKISLRGEVSSIPISKAPILGHLDIELVSADRTVARCLTVRPRLDHKATRKRYSLKLEAIPEPGSIVRVWHDPARIHISCDSSRPPARDSATEFTPGDDRRHVGTATSSHTHRA